MWKMAKHVGGVLFRRPHFCTRTGPGSPGALSTARSGVGECRRLPSPRLSTRTCRCFQRMPMGAGSGRPGTQGRGRCLLGSPNPPSSRRAATLVPEGTQQRQVQAAGAHLGQAQFTVWRSPRRDSGPEAADLRAGEWGPSGPAHAAHTHTHTACCYRDWLLRPVGGAFERGAPSA